MEKYDLAYIEYGDLVNILTTGFIFVKGGFWMEMEDFKNIIVRCPTYAESELEAKLKVIDKLNGCIYIALDYYEDMLNWLNKKKEGHSLTRIIGASIILGLAYGGVAKFMEHGNHKIFFYNTKRFRRQKLNRPSIFEKQKDVVETIELKPSGGKII